MSEIDPKLLDLIGEYFDLGYAEGAAGRDADTMAGDAQRVLSEITALIQSQAAEIERLTHEVESAGSLRLRMEAHKKSHEAATKNFLIMQGTAAELVADLARAREALAPFAQIAQDGTMIDGDDSDDQDWFRHDGACLTVGDFRRARAALPNTTGEAE